MGGLRGEGHLISLAPPPSYYKQFQSQAFCASLCGSAAASKGGKTPSVSETQVRQAAKSYAEVPLARAVRRLASAKRHLAISLWLPFLNTSGTSRPSHTGGRV